MLFQKVVMEKKLTVLSRSQHAQMLWSQDCHLHHVCVQIHWQQMWVPHFGGRALSRDGYAQRPIMLGIKSNLNFVTMRTVWMSFVRSGTDDATQICYTSKTPCMLTWIWDAVATGLVQPECWIPPRTESQPVWTITVLSEQRLEQRISIWIHQTHGSKQDNLTPTALLDLFSPMKCLIGHLIKRPTESLLANDTQFSAISKGGILQPCLLFPPFR